MVERTSVSLLVRSSEWPTGVGNLPALERPGPSRRGICLRRVSELRNASYFFASFLTNFLFLFSLYAGLVKAPEQQTGTYFFKSSTLMYSSSICLARSMSAASPSRQIDILGRGMLGNLFTGCDGVSTTEHEVMRQNLGTRDGTYLTVPEKRLSLWGS